MMDVTFSKQWIHFLLSDRWPPTSTILKQEETGLILIKSKTVNWKTSGKRWITQGFGRNGVSFGEKRRLIQGPWRPFKQWSIFWYKNAIYSPPLSENYIFPPLGTIVFQLLSCPFCLHSSLFCINLPFYFKFLFFFHLSSFSVPFLLFLTFSTFFCSLFIFFPPKWHRLIFQGRGKILQYIDICLSERYWYCLFGRCHVSLQGEVVTHSERVDGSWVAH